MAAIFIRTFLIYLFLSISIRIMGKRQIGELEINELVTTLVISEVAALPIADPDIPLLNAVIPVLLIVCLEIILSAVKNKSAKLKKYIEGEPLFLIYKGKLNQKALKENRISVNELLCEIRMQGVASINDVKYAILEQNGKISVFDKSESKNFAHTLIVDEDINEAGLTGLGYDGKWLKNELKKKNLTQHEIFLMTIDDEGSVFIIKKEEKDENS